MLLLINHSRSVSHTPRRMVGRRRCRLWNLCKDWREWREDLGYKHTRFTVVHKDLRSDPVNLSNVKANGHCDD